MGQEIFKILDTNQDEILNQNDVEKFVENAEKISVQIDNKVKGKNSLKIIKNSHTVRNLHFLVQKFNFDFPRKLSIFWVKNS